MIKTLVRQLCTFQTSALLHPALSSRHLRDSAYAPAPSHVFIVKSPFPVPIFEPQRVWHARQEQPTMQWPVEAGSRLHLPASDSHWTQPWQLALLFSRLELLKTSSCMTSIGKSHISSAAYHSTEGATSTPPPHCPPCRFRRPPYPSLFHMIPYLTARVNPT
jgi:hypothetical protein